MVVVSAKNKSIGMSPRKIREVADMVRSLTPTAALSRLEFMPKVAARPLAKTIRQAIANASHNLKIEEKALRFKEILVDEGKSVKRIDKSHGSRFQRGIIKKKSAHITVVLESEG